MSAIGSVRVHGGSDALGAARFDFSTNSHAAGPCPQALAAVQVADATRYPDATYTALRAALADFHGVVPGRIDWVTAIICAVNGIACGAGMDLVTTADITVASERATLMDPHVSIGVASGREGVRLARILPLPVAMRLNNFLRFCDSKSSLPATRMFAPGYSVSSSVENWPSM